MDDRHTGLIEFVIISKPLAWLFVGPKQQPSELLLELEWSNVMWLWSVWQYVRLQFKVFS